MAQLKYYRTENDEFAETYDKQLNHKETEIVFQKLLRHFKLRGWIKFTNRVGGGSCGRSGRVKLRWNTNFGVLCHEVAHLYEFTKHGGSRHAKRHKRIMARIIRYCQKKQWWADEVVARLAPKPVKVVTAEEKKTALILQRQQQISRYEKRLAYFVKLYKNKIGKAKRSLAALSRLTAAANVPP